MTTYYLSENGGAANKGASTLSLGMSVAVHNAETFSADDVIKLINDGGAITSTINPPSSGSTGAPIIYNLGLVECNPTTGQALLFDSVNFVTVNDINGNGNGLDAYVESNGTSGTGGATGEITNILNDAQILSNGSALASAQAGDDCDAISLNATSRLIANNPYIRDCYNHGDPTSASNNSHQAFTAHTSSILVVNNPNVDQVTYWAIPTAGSRIYINGGTIKGALVGTFELPADATADCRLVVEGASIFNDSGAKSPSGGGTATVAASMTIRGGTWTATSGILGNNRNTLTYQNVTFVITNGAANFYHGVTVGGITNVIGCDFGAISTTSGYSFRVTDGALNFIGNRVASYEDAGGRFIRIDDAAAASGYIQGNYLGHGVDYSPQGFIWIAGTSVGTVHILDNVCGSTTTTTERFIDNDGVIDKMNYNTFINITNVIDNAGGASVTEQIANNYYNSEDAGGTGGVVLLDDELNVATVVGSFVSSSSGGGFTILDNLNNDAGFNAIFE